MKTAQKSARDSYRLDKTLYEPLTISIASSFNCIEIYEREIKSINIAIEKTLKDLCPDAFTVLQSEIGDIHAFHSADALAKYSGIYWNRHQSADYEAVDTSMSKTGNKYLRYYLIEATNSIRCYEDSFAAYYRKKYDETKTHHHKRALALTSRKTIRLIYSLLDKNQLYSANIVQIAP